MDGITVRDINPRNLSGRRPWTKQELESLKGFWAEHGTKRKAAEAASIALGRPASAIFNAFDYYGIRMDEKPRMCAATRRKLIRDRFLHSGWTVDRLADETGFHVGTIRLDLKALGLQRELIKRHRSARAWRCRTGEVTRARDAAQNVESVRQGWPPVTRAVRRWLEALERLGGRAALRPWADAAGFPVRYRYAPLLLEREGFVTSISLTRGRKVYSFAPEVAERRKIFLSSADVS